MLKLLLVTLLCFSIGQAARILAVLPTASFSHQIVYRPLLHELVNRGHEVVVITPDPAFPNGGAPANLTEIDVHDISYKFHKEIMSKNLKNALPAEAKFKDRYSLIVKLVTNTFETQLKSDNVQNFLKDRSQKFDLLILETFVRPALVFSHLYKAPVIQISSFGALINNIETVGAPGHPLLYPINHARKIDNLSLWEKFIELYNSFQFTTHLSEASDEIQHSMLRRVFGQDVPSLEELSKNVDMLFLNVHPLWDSNRPVPPNVVYMGGLHQIPEKNLPEDLKQFLDSSKNGVIYMSFGTNAHPKMFPPNAVQIFKKVFSTLPYNILWKWCEELTDLPKNVKIYEWFPQSDLLRHPKIKLFVTQGGLQSTDESITGGVPLVGIPMLGDQWYNVEMYKRHEIGVGLDLLALTEDKFKNAILTVLEDDSYRQNIVKIRSIINDQPQTPLERAVWWTEHVLRHGGARHLRSPAANMPLSQYYELELVSYLLIGLLVVLVVSVFLVTRLYKVLIYFLYSQIKVKKN